MSVGVAVACVGCCCRLCLLLLLFVRDDVADCVGVVVVCVGVGVCGCVCCFLCIGC